MRIAFFALVAAAGLAAVAGPVESQSAASCRLSLRAEAETASFADAGRNAAGAAEMARQTGSVFAAAASHLCASGVVRPAHLTGYNRLLVRNAEGADNPNIYDDAEEQPGALIIEYAFADGPAPAQPAVEAALRCWRDPAAAGCAAEDVGP